MLIIIDIDIIIENCLFHLLVNKRNTYFFKFKIYFSIFLNVCFSTGSKNVSIFNYFKYSSLIVLFSFETIIISNNNTSYSNLIINNNSRNRKNETRINQQNNNINITEIGTN